MIDFACKQFNLKDIIKCSQGLTKADFAVFEYLLKRTGACTTESIAKQLNLDVSTVQRAVKKLHEKALVRRLQKNLSYGGYVYTYQIQDRNVIKKTIMETVNNWTARVEKELDGW